MQTFPYFITTITTGLILLLFIGPESDHCLPLSLTHSCLVNLIDVTLACEDANSKLVDVVTVADLEAEVWLKS